MEYLEYLLTAVILFVLGSLLIIYVKGIRGILELLWITYVKGIEVIKMLVLLLIVYVKGIRIKIYNKNKKPKEDEKQSE